VDILVSTDGGASWERIVEGTEDDGSYEWEVDAAISDNCLVRVCMHYDQRVGDVSERSFSVYEPVDWLTVFPDSGEVPEGSSSPVELTFDTTRIDEGEYHAELVITSNAGGPVVVPVTLEVGQTGLDDRIPQSVVLYGNFPNPFGPATRVAFSTPHGARASLSIYTVSGRLVRTVPAGRFSTGRHTIVWDGTDDSGESLAGGVYFYRLDVAGKELRGKMVKIR
jgi:hypothetical protein